METNTFSKKLLRFQVVSGASMWNYIANEAWMEEEMEFYLNKQLTKTLEEPFAAAKVSDLGPLHSGVSRDEILRELQIMRITAQ